MKPRIATPEQVSAILRDDNSPLYPTAIVVYCDDCGIEMQRDYIVSAEQSRPERLEVAREHLRAEGWQCNAEADLCPACSPQTAPAPHGPGAARQVAETLAARGEHSHLHADGETLCLSGGCTTRTPGEVLL